MTKDGPEDATPLSEEMSAVANTAARMPAKVSGELWVRQ